MAGRSGQLLADLLDQMGIRQEFVPAEGETRQSVVLVDLAVNLQSTISVPTLRASPAHLEQLLAVVECYAPQAWGVICAGSLPPGLPADSLAQLVRRARQLGLCTLLDSSAEALCQGVAGMPHVLKVNRQELAALDPAIAGDDVALAARLRERLGVWASDALIVTLGERGALAVTSGGAYLARPPKVPVMNTAGAGDALSGALMLERSRGADWPAALALGTAAAASVVMNEGTAICRREQVERLLARVQIERVGELSR